MKMQRMIRQVPTEELRTFFEELRDFHLKEKHDFPWEWDKVSGNGNNPDVTRGFVHYIAYNLSKNILHGPLPSSLHARMVFEESNWSKKYFDYLEGNWKAS